MELRILEGIKTRGKHRSRRIRGVVGMKKRRGRVRLATDSGSSISSRVSNLTQGAANLTVSEVFNPKLVYRDCRQLCNASVNYGKGHILIILRTRSSLDNRNIPIKNIYIKT